jgi:hypothetical protein
MVLKVQWEVPEDKVILDGQVTQGIVILDLLDFQV